MSFGLSLSFSVTVLCCSARFMTRMKLKQHISLIFLVKLKKTLTECFQILTEVYGDNIMSRMRVFEWHKLFVGGWEEVEDDE
jgi:hypothetical protein